MSTEFEKASDVAEYLLRRTGVALMGGDFDAFAPCFILPQHIETIEGRRFVTDRETLYQIFSAVRANYRERGVTRVDRYCMQADFKSENRIESLHEARVYRGEELLQPPYQAFSRLERKEGECWKVAYSLYAITQTEDHINTLSSVATQEQMAAV